MGLRPLRVIDTDLAEPHYTVALDEAIALARSRNEVPDTLHLYRRSRPTVSLGLFQEEDRSVNMALARERGVTIVRRMSGGSAIYTDQGQIIYAIALSPDDVPEGPTESYPMICDGIVRALASLGIQARWRSLNDVEVDGRKISGSAQTRKKGVVLQHGTLLVDTDLDLMVSLLRRKEGAVTRGRDRLTTIRQELGQVPMMSVVKEALIEGFASSLQRRPYRGILTASEKNCTQELLGRKDITER